MRLKDKVAVITGAGSGIGRATTLLFTREGARVVVADIETDRAEETVRAARARGGTAIAVRTDVSKEDDVREVVQAAVGEFGKLDVMFNNAAIGYSSSTAPPFEEVPEATWDRLVAVNLTGVFFGCKHAIPPMKENGGGSIINTSSTVGIIGLPNNTPYSATKAAVLGLTMNLALDLGPFNIRVNAIAPGGVGATNLALAPGAPVVGQEERERKNAAATWDHIPLRRAAHADLREFAYAALFLASDESSYITGVTIPVDGGALQARARPRA